MDPWKQIEERLHERDALEHKDSQYYKAFSQLARLLPQNGSTLSEKERVALILENETLIERLNQQTLRLEALERKSQEQEKKIRSLEAANQKLTQKIDTLAQEIKEKNRAVEIINDEHLIHELQQNVLKDEIKKLKEENEQLVQRWMAKVAQDADSMNLQNDSGA